ncbi:hypothetical protein SCOCK_50166 [Actinacidiphila cocklensis]|uniref:Uncharacterized protein n=1 Tax=Actinacidiphila cocklensis TaxID=887465 RepID=A0A9W4GVW2_9ACTN|nr:hypothetical protein SCOCK_50166 [Actinacidiphila cocklensis]
MTKKDRHDQAVYWQVGAHHRRWERHRAGFSPGAGRRGGAGDGRGTYDGDPAGDRPPD